MTPPSPPVLIIVNGPPASGKSSIGEVLARELGLPFFSKDTFKERLADTLHVAGIDWSHALGDACFVLLFEIAESMTRAGQSAILEGDFRGAKNSGRLRRVADDTGTRIIQVSCEANGELLLDRYLEREEEGKRHPIHIDAPHSEEDAFRSGLLQGFLPPLDIDGEVIRVDTSDFDNVDIPGMARDIQTCLAGTSGAGQVAAQD